MGKILFFRKVNIDYFLTLSITIQITSTHKDGINHAKFCALKGRWVIALGRSCSKPATFKPSTIPNNKAIAVTGVITRDG